jgi:membrane protein
MNFKNFSWKKLFSKIESDKIFELAAALSYYTVLSLAPFLILTIALSSLVGDSFKTDLIYQIENLIGDQAARTIQGITESAKNTTHIRNWAGFFGISTLFLSAGAIFGQLRRSLNQIFGSQSNGGSNTENIVQVSISLVKDKFFNMGIAFVFMMICITSLIISSIISLYVKINPQYFITQVLSFLFSILIFSGLFIVIYTFLPNRRLPKKVTVITGIITAILFCIGNSLIGIYLAKSALASSYGAAGSLILLLVWAYYSSIIIFMSAEISAQISAPISKD